MLTAELFENIQKFDKKAKQGDFTAITKQLELVYGIPAAVARKIDLRDLSFDAIGMVTEAIVTPEKVEAKQEGGEVKNGARPGEKGLVKSPPKSQAHRSKS